MSMPESTPLYRKNITDGGLDADKDPNPRARMQYLALDTQILYICFEDGIWIRQPMPFKIPQYAEPTTFELSNFNGATLSYEKDLCYLAFHTNSTGTLALNGYGGIISTAPTAAQINRDNILAAACRYPGNGPSYVFNHFDTGIIKAGTVLYFFTKMGLYTTFDELIAAAATFAPSALTTSNAIDIKYASYLKTAEKTIQ